MEDRREWFRAHSPAISIWVAELDGAIAGWLCFCEFSRDTLIAAPSKSAFTSGNNSGAAVSAENCLAEAVVRGPQLGMQSLVGLIFSNNEPSIALFRVAGFDRWGLLPAVARIDETPRDLTIFGRYV